MFSSPSRGTPRRRLGGAAVAAAPSVRSGTAHNRASTPTLGRHAGRRREDSISSTVDIAGETSMRPPWSEKRKKLELKEGSILSRDELHAVTIYCRMPIEVTTMLQQKSQYDPCVSVLDPQTGFAYLCTQEKCFIWSFAGRGLDSPPCYVFPVSKSATPSSSIIKPVLPFCSLLNRGGNREPAVIILTPNGDVGFVENVTSSFNPDRIVHKTIPLGSGETITELHRCGTSIFLAATSQSRLFSIRFIASGGSLQAQIAPFTQSKGIFGRIFGTSSQLGSSSGIVSLTSRHSSDNSGAFEVYAIGEAILQKWIVVEGGGERLVVEEDLRQRLLDQMVIDFIVESFALVDVAVTGAGMAAILFCHAREADGPLRYQIAFVDSNTSTPTFSIISVCSLDYIRYADTRPYSRPRLLFPYGGPAIFVIFPEAVVIRLVQSNSFEEVIEMRDVASNRIIGLGSEGPDVEGPAGISNLSIVTAVSGALLVEVDVQQAQELDQLLSSDSDKIAILTRRLKSKIERGVFHSNELQNPISFDLPQEIGGNLMTAVEQLSEEIVQSSSIGLSNSGDLRVQLADRLEKLHGLASFLAASDKLGLLSQNVLRKLCSDAELVAAAIDVWDFYSISLGDSLRQEGTLDPLANAITATIEAMADISWEGDMVRTFFRSHLQLLNQVIVRLSSNAEAELASTNPRATLIGLNHMLLSVFQAAYRYRSETANLYRPDLAHISFDGWICQMSNINALQRQYKTTLDMLQDRKITSLDQVNGQEDRAEENASQEQILRGQMCDLATCILDLYDERVQILLVAGGSDPSLEKEGHSLQEVFKAARSEIILSLMDINRSDRAFFLAEKHKDFHVLTLLCSSLKDNAQIIRIQRYLDKYQYEFASELYEHYLETGAVTRLLNEEEGYYTLLSKFLQSKEEYNRIAWLHDINLKQWNQASNLLKQEAELEVNRVQNKKLMLSLCKLSYVAQLNEQDVASIAEQKQIEMVDDQIDIINVHQKLREELQGNTAQRLRIDIEEALEVSTEVLSETSPAFKEIYTSLAIRLFDGAVLSCEDLMDLLTLPDASDQSIEHYKTAFEVFVRKGKSLPSAREPEVLASLWRRILLHDDWLEVTDTTLASTSDEVLIAKLKSTAYFQILQSISENASTAETIRDPEDWLLPFSIGSLQARFRKESPELIDALEQDYESEVQRAAQFVEMGMSKGWFDDVNRLLKEEQEQRDEDVMDDGDSQFLTVY